VTIGMVMMVPIKFPLCVVLMFQIVITILSPKLPSLKLLFLLLFGDYFNLCMNTGGF
jgi:hypothetical protein